ncbi:MAG: hypothetical protein QM757_16150 [Paludibaculum sp.]
MGAAWLAQHPWEHYRFTQDREVRAPRRGYPFMKGAAEFILDFLVETPAGTPVAGMLVTAPSHSPENRFRKPDGTDLDVHLRSHDGQFHHSRPARKRDRRLQNPEHRRRFPRPLRSGRRPPAAAQDQRAHGPPDGVGRGLRGTGNPSTATFRTCSGLHPSEQINVRKTPEFAAAARKTLEVRGDKSTGWSTAWKMNFWARLQDPERAYKLWTMLITTCTLPNLFDSLIRRSRLTATSEARPASPRCCCRAMPERFISYRPCPPPGRTAR